MMVYSFYDSAAMAFSTPFFMPNDGLAIRAFQDNVNADKQTNNIAAHPEQFTLFKIGEFDDSKAQLIELQPKKELGVGIAYIQDTNKQYSNTDLDSLSETINGMKLAIQRIEENYNREREEEYIKEASL